MKNSKVNEEHNGLECPTCRFKIKFTMIDLVMKKNITCPSCQSALNMDVPADMKQHLQEIILAEQMVRESNTFSR